MFTRLALTITIGAALGAQAPGLRIFQSTGNHQTQMVDLQGNIVHSWAGVGNLTAEICPDGTLLRSVVASQTLNIGGVTGRIQRLALDGTLLWDFLIDGPFSFAHHDLEPMPNGNVLVIAWENYTNKDAISRGRHPLLIGATWYPDSILEIEPTGPTTGTVVWEWHAIDHLIQDWDPTKANYGVVGAHPELLDINYPPLVVSDGDWNHANGLDYDPINDWIMVSFRSQHEIYLIDHSTTTAEAAGHTGGQRGKGGDFLYRWGNPHAYRAGTAAHQQLQYHHDPRFIPPGYPGAGHVTVFNNDLLLGLQSQVVEIELPLDTTGNIVLDPTTGRYGPVAPFWMYAEPGFYTQFAGSAQRLQNGNTLVCSARQARLFEVTDVGQIVWSFTYPNSNLVFHANYVERSLWTNTDVLPVGGGQVGFEHLIGTAYNGDFFLLLGSVSGTLPGTPLTGGLLLPLNADFLTDAMAANFNSGLFVNTIGTLGLRGNGGSSIVVPPGFIPPALAGTQLDFAHLVFNQNLNFLRVSNPVGVKIVP